jgi:hypothetical protein
VTAPRPAYPFLYGAFMVLSLYASNITEYPLGVVLQPLAVVLGGTLVALVVAALFYRDTGKAALLVAVALFFFLSFSFLRTVLPDVSMPVGSRRIHSGHALVVLALGLIGLTAWRLRRAVQVSVAVTKTLNVFTLVLLLMPVGRISWYRFANRGVTVDRPAATQAAATEGTAERRHVFHIVLDGYGRADQLRAVYGYDNGPFLDALRRRGFHVAQASRTNYSHTVFSLGSTLNMEYLDWMTEEFPAGFRDLQPAAAYLRQSAVRGFLAARGYRFGSVWSGYAITEMVDADVYVDAFRQQDEFRRGFWNLTPLQSDREKAELERQRILQGFDALPELAASDDPMFVVAHIIAPHPPFVFDGAGAPVALPEYIGMTSANGLTNEDQLSRVEYMAQYIEQLRFVNQRLLQTIDGILEQSAIDPVIIVQGDHGPGSFLCHYRTDHTYLQDRMAILYALRLPGDEPAELADDMTPVNTYRVVFNRYFEQSLPLLENRSFFSSVMAPYAFNDVTDDIGSAADSARYALLLARENSGMRTRSTGPDAVCPVER